MRATNQQQSSSRSHASKARRFAKAKKWAGAIREMSRSIALEPKRRDLKQALLKWSKKAGDSDEVRKALRLIARHDHGFTGYQALRQLHDWSGSGKTVPERAKSILRQLDLRVREISILRVSNSAAEQLQLLVSFARLDDCLTLLHSLSAEQRQTLPMRIVASLIQAFRHHHRANELRSMFSESEWIVQNPEQLGSLAYGLAVEGQYEVALSLLSRLRADQYTGLAFHALLRCADARGDVEGAAAIVEDWLARRPHDVLPNKRRLIEIARNEAARLIDELNKLAPELKLQPRDYAQLVEAALETDPTAALDVAYLAASRFPEDVNLGRKLMQVATTAASEELAKEAHLRSHIVGELSRSLLDIVGVQEIVRIGGSGKLHKALMDAAAGSGGAGLLILSELCLSTLRVVVTRRQGRRRETRELHELGAASWDALQQQYTGLAAMIRSICLTALQCGEDHKRVMDVLAGLQSILLEDSEFARMLCRLSLGDASGVSLVGPEIWTTALSCDDTDLHAQFAELIAEGEGRILRWMDIDLNNPPNPPLEVTRRAYDFEKTVKVFAPNFTGEISTTISSQSDLAVDVTTAFVYDGYLVSMDEENLWTITATDFLPKTTAVLLHTGTKSAAVIAPPPAVEITTPTIFVPGIRACYTNYFHFAGQILPRILSARDRLASGTWSPSIALPEFAAPFVYDMLEICGIGRDALISIPSSEPVRLTRAWLVNPSLNDWQCSPEEISRTREILQMNGPKARPTRKLYLSRPVSSVKTRGRAVTNELELLEIARSFGFEVVDPGAMTQTQQRDLFGEAALICGAVGAAMTNSLYMPAGGEVICIGPLENTRTFFPGLTLEQDIAFTWVLGTYDPDLVHSRSFPHLPFSVAPSDFRRALERACA